MESKIYMGHALCGLRQIMTHRFINFLYIFLAISGGIEVLFARLFLRYDFPKVRFSYLRIFLGEFLYYFKIYNDSKILIFRGSCSDLINLIITKFLGN